MQNSDPNMALTPSDDKEEAAESKKASPADTERAQKFLDMIKTREKEFDTGWWKQAKLAEDIFCVDKANLNKTDETPYNILYSNTEVLLPSLYSATPKPDVRSRYRGVDIKPIPTILDRFLTVAADPSSPGGDFFDGAMSDAVLNSLVPGMGYVRIRYIEDKAFPIVFESGHYRTLIWAKATRWSKVPWIAFKHPMSKDQMFSQFEIPLDDQVNFEPSTEVEGEDKNQCFVYEVWDKVQKKIYYVSEEWGPKELKVAEDPLGLENFYPTPGPLIMTEKPGKFLPTPLYNFYKNQAEELNRVTIRLNRVLSAIKVRGAYNGLLGDDIKNLLSSEDSENALVAAGEAGLLAQSGGFDKHIWLLPIERFIEVAQELYKARESIKQVIYEITGISDIIRGSSVASETATAQDLKNKWGTVRLRRMQTTVANYARDLFRMAVDCASDHIPPEQWKLIVQMPEIPTEKEKAIAKQTLAYTMQNQPPQIPGQPAPPPDPKIAQLQQTLSTPSWEELLGKIKSDMNRTFVVNIQTSSTVDLDTAQDKSEVSEFMNSMGQILPGLQPLAALGPTGLEAAKAILMAVCSRFKFGIDIADVIKNIQAPPPPTAPEKPAGPPSPSPEEMQLTQLENQGKIAAAQATLEITNAKKALELAKIQTEQAKLSNEIELSNLRVQEQRTKMAIKPKGPANATVSN